MSNQPPSSNDSLDNFLQSGPSQPAPKSSMSIWLILGLIAAGSVPIMCVCAGLLLPAVQAAREASRRMSCSNNLKQVGLAMHNYHDVYGSFPPAYTVDEAGQPLHSWRTLILPFMEQQSVYDQIDLTKPWNDPSNAALAETMIPAYACPSASTDPNMTTYVAVVDPGGIMTGPRPTAFRDVFDGTSNTLMIVETHPSRAVPWMSPQDIDLPTFMDTSSPTSNHPGGMHIVLGDGAVQFITDSMTGAMRENLVSRESGDDDVGGVIDSFGDKALGIENDLGTP